MGLRGHTVVSVISKIVFVLCTYIYINMDVLCTYIYINMDVLCTYININMDV